MPKTPKPKYNMWQNSCFMLSLAAHNVKSILPFGLAATFASLAGSLVSLFVTPALLSAVETHAPLSTLLTSVAVFALLLLLTEAAKTYLNGNLLFGRVELRLLLLCRLSTKCATTSLPNLENDDFHKLHAKTQEAVNNNRSAAEAIWNTLFELLRSGLGFVIYLCLLTAVDPLLLAVVLVTSLGGYLLSSRLNGWGYRHREEETKYLHALYYVNHNAGEIDRAKDIRLFHLRPWLQELYDKAKTAYQAFHRREQRVVFWGAVADLALAFVRNGAAYALLIAMTLRDGLSAAQFLLYFSAVGGFSEWVTSILLKLTELRRQSLVLSSVREFLEYPEPFSLDSGEPVTPEPGKQYELVLEDVSFRYPGAERDTLSQVNLTLRPGEKLAVVGLNGAGKTTLVKLLCGFLDPTGGRVLLNGRDIRAFNRRDYYTMFAAVFQNFSILADTIEANVTSDWEHPDETELRACVEKAGLREKLERLPDGCQSLMVREVFEDAAVLSGGETQRLMLARALYKASAAGTNAPFILLDEPTAALDPIAEAELYGKYSEMTAGRSSVYISHRLASTRFCDRVLYIENGGIAEEGTHDELLRRGGRYAELFEIQSRYYQKEAEGHEEA